MESTRGNTHSVTFFPPGNVFFGSMISTMHPLTTNTAAVLRRGEDAARGMGSPEPRERARVKLGLRQPTPPSAVARATRPTPTM